MTDRGIEEKLKELNVWFRENPQLPQEIDSILLKRFLKCMYYDVAETKKLIHHHYTLRNKHAHLFLKRDPDDEKTQSSLRTIDLIPLPGLTPERFRILFHRLSDADPSKMNSIEECKIFFMVTDARFTLIDAYTADAHRAPADSVDNLADGEVHIMDIAGYSMSHMARISILVLRIYLKFLQEAYPVRLRAMHIVNCPSFLNKMIAILKPFINDEVYKLINFHTNGIDSLYEHVPREMLPDEYGGKAGKIDDLKAQCLKVLVDKKKYLMDERQWKIAPSVQHKSRWLWF